MINDIFIIIILILISAFFSGTETAMFSLGQMKYFKPGDAKNAALNRLRNLLQNPELLLSVILLGNLAVNIIFSHYAHNFLITYTPSVSSGILNLIIITFVLLVSGEIIPKVLALRFSEKWALKVSWIMKLWIKVTRILSLPLNFINSKITSLIPEIKHKLNENELLDTLRFAHKDGIIPSNEYKVLQRTIHFYYDTAYSIMIPRSNVTMISSNDDYNKIKKKLLEKKTNFALIFNKKDNRILGYISARSITPYLISKKLNLSIITQPIVFLPKTLLLNEVLEELIKNHIEVCAVIDEMGEFSGIVTMKDIYHTLLGSLEDEQMLEEESNEKDDIYKVKKNIYRISGQTSLHEFNEFFNTDIVSENSETISGFIIEKLDGYPRKNTIFTYKTYKFYNMQINNNVIEFMTMKVENEL